MIVGQGSGRAPKLFRIGGIILLVFVLVVFAAILVPAWILRSLMKNLLGDGKILAVGSWVLVALMTTWLIWAVSQQLPSRWPFYWLLVALVAKSSRSPLSAFPRRSPNQPQDDQSDPKIIEI